MHFPLFYQFILKSNLSESQTNIKDVSSIVLKKRKTHNNFIVLISKTFGTYTLSLEIY